MKSTNDLKSLPFLVVLLFLLVGCIGSESFNKQSRSFRSERKTEQASATQKQETATSHNSAEAYLAKGVIYQDQNRHKAAVIQFQRAIELDPGSATAYMWLAKSLRQLDRQKEAITAYQKIGEIDPQDTRINFLLADTYYSMGEFQKSIEHSRLSLSEARVPKTAWHSGFKIGLCYLRLGNYAQAQSTYMETLRMGEAMNLGSTYIAERALENLIADGIEIEGARNILRDVFGRKASDPLIFLERSHTGFSENSETSDSTAVPFDALTKKPTAIKRAEAKYPELAKKAGIEGIVVVKVLVDENGDVIKAKLLKSHPLLDEPALEAAMQFKFTPGLQKEQKVKVWMSVPFSFRLK